MTSPYTPNNGSLAQKVLAFFAANPEETLTAHDISLKFDVNHAGVHTRLDRIVAEGQLIRATDDDGDPIYYRPDIGKVKTSKQRGRPIKAKPEQAKRPHPAAPRWPYAVAIEVAPPEPPKTAQPKATERMAKAAKAATQGKAKFGSRLPVLDTAALDYRTDVPHVRQQGPRGHLKHANVLDGLTLVGQSVGIPDGYHHALRAAITKYKKKHDRDFKVGRAKDGQMRIWRLK